MSNWIIYSIGFLAQLLFSSRLIIQWLKSEKEKQSVTPRLFWILSLIASVLLFIYGFLRDDFAIMLGQLLTYFIYIRNLQLQKVWQKLNVMLRSTVLLFPLIAVLVFLLNKNIEVSNWFQNKEIPQWLLFLGIISQMVFTFRFIYQWVFSEVKKKSTLPFGFWILSCIGAVLILIYGVFRNDPVLIIAHLFGIIIYLRNIYFIKTNSYYK